MRTAYCGTIRATHIDQEVTLCGWVDRRRDHGGVIFIDLRDREGVVQVVFDPDAQDNFALADKVRSEYVLKVTGRVRARTAETVNAKMPTGEIEVYGTALEILNEAQTTPFPLDARSEEHTSELQSRPHLVCRLLLEKKKKQTYQNNIAEAVPPK